MIWMSSYMCETLLSVITQPYYYFNGVDLNRFWRQELNV